VQALKFGLLAETAAQLDDLVQLVNQTGHEVALALKASSGCLENVAEVEAWVARLDLQHEKSITLMEELEAFDVPVIYDDIESYSALGQAERVSRFASKIQLCTGTGAQSGEVAKADEVWVLAGSTGGPEAVGLFLKALPENITGVAFIYVQHINAEISATLQRALLLSTSWAVLSCDRAQPLLEKCIYIVSPSHQVDIHNTGVIAPVAETWVGLYQPSADQVIAKVARNFGKRSGVIVFSGMGDDGAQSCSYMRGSGGVVWAQSPDTCAVDSMPVSAIKTGAVTYQGPPETLARQFVHGRHLSQVPSAKIN